MGMKVERREKSEEKTKKPHVDIKRTMQTSPIDFMMMPNNDRAKEDAEILVKAAEVKQDRARYNAAKKLIRGAINI